MEALLQYAYIVERVGIVKLFSVDSEITSIGKTALQIICFSLVIGGIMPVIQAYFLALGYGKKVLFLSLEVFLPFAYRFY